MNMAQTLEVLQLQQKGGMMNTLESCNMHEAHKQGLQLNEAVIEPYNPIFKIITKNRLNRNSPTSNDQANPTLPITAFLASHQSPHSPQQHTPT
jgi:hypothetical protein